MGIGEMEEGKLNSRESKFVGTTLAGSGLFPVMWPPRVNFQVSVAWICNSNARSTRPKARQTLYNLLKQL